MEPVLFRGCDGLLWNLQGRLEILAVSGHAEGDTSMDHYDDHEDVPPLQPKESTNAVLKLSEKIEKQSLSSGGNAEAEIKQNKCSTCNPMWGMLSNTGITLRVIGTSIT